MADSPKASQRTHQALCSRPEAVNAPTIPGAVILNPSARSSDSGSAPAIDEAA